MGLQWENQDNEDMKKENNGAKALVLSLSRSGA